MRSNATPTGLSSLIRTSKSVTSKTKKKSTARDWRYTFAMVVNPHLEIRSSQLKRIVYIVKNATSLNSTNEPRFHVPATSAEYTDISSSHQKDIAIIQLRFQYYSTGHNRIFKTHSTNLDDLGHLSLFHHGWMGSASF
jgi:hypothetical protein